ncbi:MAG: HAD-IC family P-type ATPase, partial [Planctomycetales bacterium]|nr:HAD-IC family P-type ATPase [Planctomycetales bacterium]
SDKTGTLTENRMSVTVLDIAGHRLDLTEHLRDDDQGTAIAEGSTSRTTDSCPRIDPDDPQQLALALLLAGAGLCNDAELKSPKQGEPWKAVGEPTEAALILAAARLGLPKGELNENFPRVDELPFDSDRKRMTTVHVVKPTHCEGPGYRRSAVTDVLAHLGDVERIAFMKGAVDSVLSCCEYYWEQGAPEELDDESRARIVAANDQLAAMGMRVMGVSFRPLDDLGLARSDATDHDEVRPAPPRETEEAHIFVGLIGMIDPPRPEVRDAVIRCRQAGIRPLMITGDHPLTAQHIAQQLGIANGKPVVHGTELAAMDARQMEQRAASTSVFARVAPQDKLSIVQALQKQGHVVAMTGDGVNDAPALKQSHIGVAMGRTGTDVSKEASDMILLDDNFATIVNAVEEGRIVYDNIRKFVRYTMTSNAGEVWVMVIGPLLGMPLPLLPLQILWVNLVTDGLPGLALAVEPAERETMHRAPYPPTENVMGRGMWRDIAWIGVLMGAVSMLMGFLYWYHGFDAAYWRTVVFTVLTLSQLGNVMAIRAERDSLFQIGVFSNLALVGAVALTIVLQFAVIYIPWLQSLLKTAPLSLRDLLFCLLASTIVFWSVELKKFLRRHPTYASSDS